MKPDGEVAQPGPMAVVLGTQALDEAVKKSKQLNKMIEALKKLSNVKTYEAPQKVAEAIRVLKEMEPGRLGLDVDLKPMFEVVAADQAKRVKERHLRFGKDLTEAALREGLNCTLVTTEPMEFVLPPFSVTVDLNKSLAAMRHARLTVEETPAQPDRIIEAYKKNIKQLESGWQLEQFFDALKEAYQIQCARENLLFGERVDLVELVGFVALFYQNRKFFVDPSVDNYRPYERVRFAYDLARLRNAGLLDRQGLRLNLGSATCGSTKDKRNVLYIQEGRDGGQYYATLWFTKTGKEEVL